MKTTFQYAVNFVVGEAEEAVMAPGEYWTAINIHNTADRPVRFRKKVATALPHEETGPVSELVDAKLGPDEAPEIDRRDIFDHAESRRGVPEGIRADSLLEVGY